MVDTENQTEGHAVSDERDDINGRGRTAVATRPLRPTGKRTRQVTEAIEAEPIEKVGETKAREKKKAKTAKKRGPSRNPLAFVWTFLKQVVAELRKVIWPNRKQMSTYTVVVIAFLAFMVALIGVVDLGLAKLVLLVLG